MRRHIIGLYIGGGADWQFTDAALQPMREHGYKIERLTTNDIIKKQALADKTQVAAFFLCGNAEGQRYRDELGEVGFQAIRDFTFSGGVTIGMCAGGYLLCREVDYKSPNKARVTDQNIGLIRARAVGQLPLLRPEATHLDGWFRANTASVYLPQQDRDAQLLYWGGGYIVPDTDEHLRVFARFRSVQDSDGQMAIAAAGKEYGTGWVAATGIHPEVSGAILATHQHAHHFDRDKGTHRNTLATELTAHELERRRLWAALVTDPILARTRHCG